MRDLYDQGLQDDKIGAALNVSDGVVKAWRRHHNLPSNKRGRPAKIHPVVALLNVRNKSNFSLIRELYDLGYSDQAINYVLKLHHGTTERWRAKEGLPPKNLISFVMVKEQQKQMNIALSELIEPQKDKESLFCDTEFLEQFMKKKIKRHK
jgi:hypothetical protein